MSVIKPPNSISKNHKRKYAVFLAGSIEMGKASTRAVVYGSILILGFDYLIASILL